MKDFFFFFDRLFFFQARLNKKNAIFRFFFYFAVPPTPQKRPEDGMSTKRSIVPRLVQILKIHTYFWTLP